MEIIVVDLETTGLDSFTCEIIEIGAVRMKDGKIVDEFQSFAKPTAPLTFEITNLTGITDEILADAPTLDEALDRFLHFVGDTRYFMAHNKDFESSFLDKQLPFSPKWLDSIEITKIVRPTLKYYRLSALVEIFQVEHANSHRALDDAYAAAEVVGQLLEECKTIDSAVWQNFAQLISRVDCPLSDFFKDLMLKNSFTVPTKIFLENKPELPRFDGTLFDNKIDEAPQNEAYQLKIDHVADFFDGLGDGFEVRNEQIEMSKMVGNAFNDHTTALIEAGTGTGKSLAYLLPAVMYAKGSNQPVVVSTNTINLQEQLMNKDIPLLKAQLDDDFLSVVVKGRGNYICQRKWQYMMNDVDIWTLALYMRIAHWLRLTFDGDFGELNLFGQEHEIVSKLAAHSESCASFQCSYNKNKCYVTNVRKKAAKAHLIIINHSLMLASAFTGEMGNANILPHYEHLIIDEAHQMREVAQRQLSMNISRSGLNRTLANMWLRGKASNLQKALKELPNSIDAVNALNIVVTKSAKVREMGEKFFENSTIIFRNSYANVRELRITTQRTDPKIWSGIEADLDNLLYEMAGLYRGLQSLLAEFGEMDDPFFNMDVLGTFKIAANNLSEMIVTAQNILDGKDGYTEEDLVIWAERNSYQTGVSWWVAPLDIRPTLAERLYADKKSLVMTSATLTNNDFDYFIEDMGLNMADLQIETKMLQSPFDYARNSLILNADHISDYTKTSDIVIIDEISNTLVKLIEASQGRALILFTSHQQLRSVYQNISPILKKSGINVYAHGISGGRDLILTNLKNNPKSCILGTNSFWEGVDIAGDALSLVVIVRLPFQPPNNPILEAHFEEMTKEGKNPFMEYSLPNAIIRFKQGFGRLIRTKSDRGVFCVLDQRIWSKSYGKTFLGALPKIPTKRLNADQMAEEIKNYLN